MPYYRQVGSVSPKRHIQFRRSDGELYHEEMITTQGFDGASSILYHLSPPTEMLASKAHPSPEIAESLYDVHGHHRFLTDAIQASGGFHEARVPGTF